MSQRPPDEPPPEEQLPAEEESFEGDLPEEEDYLPEEEEQLSGTLLGSLHQATQGLGGFGSALFGGGLFAVVAGGVVYLVEDSLRLYATIILGLGAGLLLIGIVTSWPSVRTTLGARRGRYGVNSVVMVAAFLGIAAVGVFLAFENVSRIDVTATNKFSLATRTKNLLEGLDNQVQATAFYVQDNAQQQAALGFVEDTLREFDARSNQFSYRVVDPDREPETARSLGMTQVGQIAFQDMATQRVHLVAPSTFLEQDFVTALLIVTEQEQKKVYFLTGHQERSIDDTDPESDGFGIAASLGLRGENYAVESFSLLGSDSQVPEDATLVVIAGPQRDFFAGEGGEIEALDQYLGGGGRLLALLDPEELDPGDEGMKDFRDFLARWGIAVQPGHVVDKAQSLDDTGRSPLITTDLQYSWRWMEQFAGLSTEQVNSLFTPYYGGFWQPLLLHANSLASVTRNLGATYYPGAASLRPTEDAYFFPPEGEPVQDPAELPEPRPLSAAALVATSSDSWRIEDLGRDEPNADDVAGPFYLGVAVRPSIQLIQELQDPSQSEGPFIMAIGDSDFASNRNFYQASNSDLFLNTVNWLAGDVSLVDIRPKPFQVRRLVLDEDQENFVRYSSYFLLPVAMALMAGIIWWRRR